MCVLECSSAHAVRLSIIEWEPVFNPMWPLFYLYISNPNPNRDPYDLTVTDLTETTTT